MKAPNQTSPNQHPVTLTVRLRGLKWRGILLLMFLALIPLHPAVGAYGIRVTAYDMTWDSGADVQMHEELHYAYGWGQTNIGYTNVTGMALTNWNYRLTTPDGAEDIVRLDSTSYTAWDADRMLLSTNWTVDRVQTAGDTNATKTTNSASFTGPTALPTFSGAYPYPFSTLSFHTASVGLALVIDGDTNNIQTCYYTIKVEAVQRGVAVPTGDITVAGTTCDADGNVSLPFADCSTNTISVAFTAAQSNVTYRVIPVGVARPQIFRVQSTYSYEVNEDVIVTNINTTTNLITGAATSVMVGEKINLFCKMAYDDGSPYTNASVTNWNWTVPGLTLSNFVHTATLGKEYVDYPKDRESCIFYWKDGSNTMMAVNCDATVTGTSIPAKAYFNVFKPEMNFTVTVRNNAAFDAIYAQNQNKPSLHFGDAGANLGITYDYDRSNQDNWSVCQTGTTINKAQALNGQWQGFQGTGLDDSFPNNDPGDSPHFDVNFPDATMAISVDDTYTSCLMYNPQTPGAIWVPISVSVWWWNGNAQNLNNNWNGAANNILGPIPTSPTTTYPEWTYRIQDLEVGPIP